MAAKKANFFKTWYIDYSNGDLAAKKTNFFKTWYIDYSNDDLAAKKQISLKHDISITVSPLWRIDYVKNVTNM